MPLAWAASGVVTQAKSILSTIAFNRVDPGDKSVNARLSLHTGATSPPPLKHWNRNFTT